MTATSAATFDQPLTACPMCRSKRIGDFDVDYCGVLISRCRDCRLLFMNPQFTDAHLAEFYSHYKPNDVARDPVIALRRQMSKADNLALIERFVRPGRFLSIGCGDGLELDSAQQRGWNAEGFDVDEASARRASARTSRPIRWGDFFELDWPLNRYDCVYMDQVLEHPKNPQDYLALVYRLLRPGGVLFIGCPNIASVSSTWKGWAGRLGLKRGRRGRHYDTSHHLFYYSPRVLGNLAERQFGYEVLASEGDPLNGRKPSVPGSTLLDRLTLGLRKKLPFLESTFRAVYRKPMTASVTASASIDNAPHELRHPTRPNPWRGAPALTRQ